MSCQCKCIEHNKNFETKIDFLNYANARQSSRIITVLACSGRVIRLLEHSRVRQTIELESVPTVLHIPVLGRGDKFVCGFADGKIVMYHVEHLGSEGQKIIKNSVC